MLKSLILAASLTFVFAGATLADDMKVEPMKCDDASMMKVEKDVMAMDAANKDHMKMGMDELAMAKDSMKAKKDDDCAMHLGKAAMESMSKM